MPEEAGLRNVKPRDLAIVAATRGMIGFGAGLLLANKFSEERRNQLGWVLFISGLASTVPIAMHLFHKKAANPLAT